MAKNEGVRRIMLTGKLIVLIGITLAVVFYVALSKFPELLSLLALLGAPLPVVAFGGLVWAAGWILQGFNQPDL
jgi:hypothetical protein